MLQESDIREFMEIWSEEFHEAISLEDARRCAAMLLELYVALTQLPPSTSQSPENQSHDHEIFPLLPKIK